MNCSYVYLDKTNGRESPCPHPRYKQENLCVFHIAFLKKLDCRRANMDGAVLHTAQVWENPRLENYSFRNAFLISVNLADKQLIDRDFTGAVFKAVLTL